MSALPRESGSAVRADRAGLAPLDRWTLAYAAVASLALVLRWPESRPMPWTLPAAHALLAGLALLAPRARGAGTAGRFVGAFYGLLLCAALYTEIGLLNAMVGTAHDDLLQRWEEALFGGQPSRDWIRAAPWPALSWLLHLGYLSYYLVLAASPLGLWLSGRRRAAEETGLLVMVAFYLCYAVFLFFPVAGPRYLFPLASNAATAIPPATLTQRILDRGAAWGTAFPSSHVAAALVAGVCALRGWRPLGLILLPLSLLLAVGTVYGQFHYAVDALAGIAVAGAVLLTRRRRTIGA